MDASEDLGGIYTGCLEVKWGNTVDNTDCHPGELSMKKPSQFSSKNKQTTYLA